MSTPDPNEPTRELRPSGDGLTHSFSPAVHSLVTLPPSPTPAGQGAIQIPGYEILDELGRGGMGVVFKARQIGLNREVALKMMLAGPHAAEEERGRFRTEAQAIARLAHANIVQVFEVSEHDGQPYFSMEFCPGGGLDKRLGGTPLAPADAAALLGTLARAMHAAHAAGVIHRDLKPANVLLSSPVPVPLPVPLPDSVSSGTGTGTGTGKATDLGTPKITDFGLAKKLDEQGQTISGAIMGTPSYMAPEQARGEKNVGPAADIYSLGAILYECLTGRPPFRAATAFDTLIQVINDEPVAPRTLNPTVPRDLEIIALKCLHKQPERRYASAADLAADLDRFLNNEPIHARPASTLERGVKWVRRRPAGAALIGVCVLAVLAVLGVSVAFNFWLQHEKQIALSERDEADRQRLQAQENFRLARQAVDEYAKKAATDPRLKERGLQDVRREWLQAAEKFYQRFVEQAGDDPEVRMEQARAYSQLASISAEISTPEDAEAHYVKARQLWEKLQADYPEREECHTTLATIVADLGGLAQTRGQKDRALKMLQEALRLRREQLARHPEEVEYKVAVAATHNALGLFHKEGDPQRAEQEFNTALRLVYAIRPRTEADRDLLSFASMCEMNLGGLYLNQEKYDLAEKHFHNARQRFEARLKQGKLTLDHRKMLALLHVSRAFLYHKKEDARQAGAAYHDALDLLGPMAEDQPHATDIQNTFATTLMMTGEHYFNLGRESEAARYYDRASLIQDRLYRLHPGVKQYRTNRLSGLVMLSKMYFASRDAEKCEQVLDKALIAARELASAHPDDPDMIEKPATMYALRRKLFEAIGSVTRIRAEFVKELTIRDDLARRFPTADNKVGLAGCCNDYGLVLYREKPAEAKQLYDRAADLLRDVLETDANTPHALPFLCNVLTNRANLLGPRSEQALADRRGVVDLRTAQVCRDPENAAARKSLAQAWRSLGETFEPLGRLTDLEKALLQEVGILEDLLRGGYPQDDVIHTRERLASAQARLATFYRYTVKDRAAEAEPLYRRAIVHHTWLAMTSPRTADHLINAGGEACNLAHLYNEAIKRPEDALPWYARAEWLLAQALDLRPDDSTALRYLRNVHGGRASTCRKLNRLPEAIAAQKQVVEYHQAMASRPKATPRQRLDLVASLATLGDMHREAGERNKAQAPYDSAAEICETLLDDARYGSEARAQLARLCWERGRLLGAAKRFKEHLVLLQRERKLREALLSANADDWEQAEALANGLEMTASVHVMLDQSAKAVEVQTEAVKRRRVEAEKYPKYLYARLALAKSYHTLGLFHRLNNDAPAAAQSLGQSCQTWEGLLAILKEKASPSTRTQAAGSYSALTQVQFIREDWAGCVKSARRCVELYQQVVGKGAATASNKVDMGGTACNLGHALVALNQLDEALTGYNLAVKTLAQVLDADAKDDTAREYLRNSHWGRATTLVKLKKWADAVKDYDRAIVLAGEGPRREETRLERAQALARLGEVSKAMAETEAICQNAKATARILYSGACVHGLVAETLLADNRVPLAVREKRAAQAAGSALALLKRAGKQGYFDRAERVQTLQKDADLAVLRGRADYQAWLKTLPAK